MLNKIKSYFEQFISIETVSPEQEKHALNLAVAAIMLEMVQMDNTVKLSELARLDQVLIKQLEIEPTELEELNKLAKQELTNSVDYHQFTSLINEHFAMDKKCEVIQSLWQIAYADGKVDSHEEHFLRKISDLLFLPHSEFIKAKLRVIPD